MTDFAAPSDSHSRDAASSLRDDWHEIEDALNAASDGATDPVYSQIESAKSALLRLGSAAVPAHVHVWDTETEEFSTFTPDPQLDQPWVIHECIEVGCLAIKVTRVLRDRPVEIVYEEAESNG
jgi:hypothetical protein